MENYKFTKATLKLTNGKTIHLDVEFEDDDDFDERVRNICLSSDFCMDAKVVEQIIEHMRCTVNSTDSWEQWPEPSEPDYTDIYWAFDKSCDETMMNETLWDFIQMLHVFFEGKLEIDM